MSELFIGLMSGTSLDGVDGVLAEFADPPSSPQEAVTTQRHMRVLQHVARPFPLALRDTFMALNTSGADEIHRAALAANTLAALYADVVKALLDQSGVDHSLVRAVGAHGQTVRHRPQEFDATGYTVQINNPALLAELIRIDVVADFRSRDVAAGGQGAPLVPAFHQAVFGQSDGAIAVLNIGGISNVTLLPAQTTSPSPAQSLPILGFDCGPGNALMDAWCQRHTGQPFDHNGQWAATGQVHGGLLASCLSDAYFAKKPPKSTGRDLFNPAWLNQYLAGFANLPAADVQCTLTELTAQACIGAVLAHQPTSNNLVVCGGGAFNGFLMERLSAGLPGLKVMASDEAGLPPLQVEAAAFAWLARQCVRREPGNLPQATGAKKGAAEGARILGGIFPA